MASGENWTILKADGLVARRAVRGVRLSEGHAGWSSVQCSAVSSPLQPVRVGVGPWPGVERPPIGPQKRASTVFHLPLQAPSRLIGCSKMSYECWLAASS